MEPNGAVAFVEGDKATIVMSTQVVRITRNEVAKRLGIRKENVNIQPTYLGGGFGRRLHTPNAMQAAIMSKAVGKPVKSFFDRKEEFQNDTFRPPTHHVLKAKLNKAGKIEAFEHNVSSGDVMFGSPLLPAILAMIHEVKTFVASLIKGIPFVFPSLSPIMISGSLRSTISRKSAISLVSCCPSASRVITPL